LNTPSDRIFADITRNKVTIPFRGRYSIGTLTWAREIMTLSESACHTITAIVLFPPEQLLCLKFINLKLGIQDALTDPSGLNELIGIWQEANGIDDINVPIPPFLAVDAVAFRSTITVDELGKVEGIQGTDHLEHRDLFIQFMINPVAFQVFVKKL
jgi:hypothetical protein